MKSCETLRFRTDPATGTLSDDDTKRYFSTVGFAFAALIAVKLLTEQLLSYLCVAFCPSLLQQAWAIYLLSYVSLFLTATPVFYWILRRLPSVRPLRTPMGFGKCLKGLCVAVCAMFVGLYVSQFFLVWQDALLGRASSNPVTEIVDNAPIWLNLLCVGIITPILEELLFRKLICRHLLPLGEGYAILLSSVMFGLCHGNLHQFFYAFALGAVFAYVYVKTGKLIYSVIYHAVINLFGSVLAPWLLSLLDEELLTQILEEALEVGTVDPAVLSEFALPLFLIFLYELFLYGFGFAGTVILFRRLRRRPKLESGLLPPPKKGRFANLFLNVGVASAITASVVLFIVVLL